MVADSPSKTTSGTPGLDDVLHGGVPAGHTTIVSGGHGTGKRTLALQFLAAGGDGLQVGEPLTRYHGLPTGIAEPADGPDGDATRDG